MKAKHCSSVKWQRNVGSKSNSISIKNAQPKRRKMNTSTAWCKTFLQHRINPGRADDASWGAEGRFLRTTSTEWECLHRSCHSAENGRSMLKSDGVGSVLQLHKENTAKYQFARKTTSPHNGGTFFWIFTARQQSKKWNCVWKYLNWEIAKAVNKSPFVFEAVTLEILQFRCCVVCCFLSLGSGEEEPEEPDSFTDDPSHLLPSECIDCKYGKI